MQNFCELDKKFRFNNRVNLLERAKDLGYTYISECVYGLYYTQERSLREVAGAMGSTTNTVIIWMTRFEFHRRGRGGNNHNERLKDPAIRERIMGLQGKVTSETAANTIGCSSSTIRAIWNYGLTQKAKETGDILCMGCGIYFTPHKVIADGTLHRGRCRKCKQKISNAQTSFTKSQRNKGEYEGRVTASAALSCRSSRGLSQQQWSAMSVALEVKRQKEHRNDKIIPLSRWMLQLGEYKNI